MDTYKKQLKRNVIITSSLFIFTVFMFAGYFATIEKPEVVSHTMENPIENSFALTNADFQVMTVQSWAKINDDFCSVDKLNQITDKILKTVKLSDLSTDSTNDTNFTSITMKGLTNNNQNVEIVLQSLHNDSDVDESFLIVNIEEKSDYQKLKSINNIVADIFVEFDVKPEVNILITGCYDHIVSKNNKQELVNNIINKTGAKKIDFVDDGQYISTSIFVPNIENKVYVNSKNINMQIAIMDNEKEKKTWVYLGNPLVFSEY